MGEGEVGVAQLVRHWTLVLLVDPNGAEGWLMSTVQVTLLLIYQVLFDCRICQHTDINPEI